MALWFSHTGIIAYPSSCIQHLFSTSNSLLYSDISIRYNQESDSIQILKNGEWSDYMPTSPEKSIQNVSFQCAVSERTYETGVFIEASKYNFISGKISYVSSSSNYLGVKIGTTDLGNYNVGSGVFSYNKEIPASVGGQIIFYGKAVSANNIGTAYFNDFIVSKN